MAANASPLRLLETDSLFAKLISRSSSFSPPTLRAAFILLRNKGSEVYFSSFNKEANAGRAGSMDQSSLMALAASVTIYSS